MAAWLGRHGVMAFGRVFQAIAEKDQLEKITQYGADFLVAGDMATQGCESGYSAALLAVSSLILATARCYRIDRTHIWARG